MVSSMTSASPSPLLEAFEYQDKLSSSAFSLLQEAIAHHQIPSASIAITHQDRLIALKALGHFTYEDNETAGAPPFSRSSREEPALSLSKGGDFDSVSSAS